MKIPSMLKISSFILIGIFFIGFLYLDVDFPFEEINNHAEIMEGKDFLLLEMYAGNQSPVSSFSIKDKKYMRDLRRISKQYGGDAPIPLLEGYYDKIGPSKMLDVFEENRFCHIEGHNLGRLVLNRTQNLNDAILICQMRCSGGCFHGVLMELFKKSVPNYGNYHITLDDVKGEFKDLCDRQEIKKFVYEGSCIHGTGHALMFLSGYNVSHGLELCRIFEPKGKRMVYQCAMGVFMEYQLRYGKELKSESLLYPCDAYTDFPAACYRYKFGYYSQSSLNYIEIAQLCLKQDEPQRRGCFHGMGYSYYIKINEKPELLQSICSFGDIIDQKMCIDGAIGSLANFNPMNAKVACDYLREDVAAHCYAAMNDGILPYGEFLNFYQYPD